MNRMGLVDFWYYTNEVFSFKDGHLLLRGSNGSGKSVTMQSFIPLLLDGNKNSERLDAFGTKARKMESYLIDEESDRNDRIAYLYLEFKREDSDIYKTIGIGMRARKNKAMQTWYFVIEDNRRINQDIQLMDHNHLAITKQMLKNQIGDQLIETQREYMQRVNKALFQFPSMDDYKEAINLLVQVRTPKLSNSLKPSMINRLLSNSLQPLSEEDLRPLTEALSNMDEIQNQLEIMKKSLQAAISIKGIYQQYNFASLSKKLQAYQKEENQYQEIEAKIKQLKKSKEQASKQIEMIFNEMEELKSEKKLVEDELSDLTQSDLLQVAKDVQRYKADLEQEKKHLQNKTQQEKNKDNLCIDTKIKVKEQEDKRDACQDEIHQLFKELDELNENLQFDEHILLKNEFLLKMDQDYDFTYTLNKISTELKELEKGIALFREMDQQKDLLAHIQNDASKEEALLEEIEKEIEQYEQQFVTLQEEYQEKFYLWEKGNHQLKLNVAMMKEIQGVLSNYLEDSAYSIIEQIIHKQYVWHESQIIEQISHHKTKYKEVSEKLQDVESQLAYWKDLKEPIFELSMGQDKTRKFLNDKGINAQPFYQFLDFDATLSFEKRNVIEEQFKQLGLLNALLIEKKDQETLKSLSEDMEEKFLFTEKKLSDLNVYFIDDSLDLNEMSKAFGFEKTSVELFEKGYQNGWITAKVDQSSKATFIGEKARQAYRKKKIEDFEKQWNELQSERQAIQQDISDLKVKLSQLEKEASSYPSQRDLEVAKQDLEKAELKQKQHIDALAQHKKRMKAYQEKLFVLKKEITAISDRLEIQNTKEYFYLRKETFTQYRLILLELDKKHTKYRSNLELLETFQSKYEDLMDDLDSIRYELKKCKLQVEQYQKMIAQKEALLNEKGYADIKERLNTLSKRLNEIPDLLFDLSKRQGQQESMQARCCKEIEEREVQAENQAVYVQRQKEIFNQELQLGYVTKETMDLKELEALIHRSYPHLKSKESLGNDFQTSFYTNRGYLQEYGIHFVTLFDSEQEGISRLDLKARYKGKQIPYMELIDHLERDIAQQNLLLDNQDRILIEDILVNTISRKIRAHIRSSKRWIETMNRYMKSMNTSSSLKLSLQWKSKKAENEDELSSENLVKLLEKDLKLLKESDFDLLSKHFRSKIHSARTMAEDPNHTQSFHQIMRDLLDYRTWFDFTILFEKTNEKKKELTDRRFFVFSGGEKAMSMYIPLFSAVAAKFSYANEDAPLLIALDEAFAGVDENNIDMMFGLIKNFGFDYIMNSQVLWGDYPNVPSLAIYELYRPNNAHYITVIRYEWNGKTKRLLG